MKLYDLMSWACMMVVCYPCRVLELALSNWALKAVNQ